MPLSPVSHGSSMEAALHELGCAAASMDEISQWMPANPMADRTHRGFMNLGLALADAVDTYHQTHEEGS